MEVTYDLYKELELDRSWDEATIKTKLKRFSVCGQSARVPAMTRSSFC